MIAARYLYFTNRVSETVSFFRDVVVEALSSPEAMDFDSDGWSQPKSGGVEVHAEKVKG